MVAVGVNGCRRRTERPRRGPVPCSSDVALFFHGDVLFGFRDGSGRTGNPHDSRRAKQTASPERGAPEERRDARPLRPDLHGRRERRLADRQRTTPLVSGGWSTRRLLGFWRRDRL